MSSESLVRGESLMMMRTAIRRVWKGGGKKSEMENLTKMTRGRGKCIFTIDLFSRKEMEPCRWIEESF
jgi:hypothetical protein